MAKKYIKLINKLIIMGQNKKSDKIKHVCVIDTPFTLFYYLLIFGVNDKDIFIMSYHIPESIRKNIDHIYFPITVICPYTSIKNILKDCILFVEITYQIFKLRIILHKKTKGYEKIKSFGHGHLLFSFPLYEYPNSAIIEDGIGNYAKLPEFKEFPPIQKFLLAKIFGKHIRKLYDGFGTHPNVKEVYLTKNEGYSDLIKDKVIVKELDELMNSIDENDKNKILKIFNADEIMKLNIKKTDILLLTEPFSEGFELTIEEEIKIYRDLISKYDFNQIVIKPHPREKKDYTKYFQGVRVITTKFPLELFDLMGIKFQKILTVNSSAALNFKDVEVEFYDGEINNEIVNMQRKQVQKQYQELKNK